MQKPKKQIIKWDNNGNPYVTHYHSRLYLSEFQRTSEGKGVLPTCNFGGYVIEILDQDYARVSIQMN